MSTERCPFNSHGAHLLQNPEPLGFMSWSIALHCLHQFLKTENPPWGFEMNCCWCCVRQRLWVYNAISFGKQSVGLAESSTMVSKTWLGLSTTWSSLDFSLEDTHTLNESMIMDYQKAGLTELWIASLLVGCNLMVSIFVVGADTQAQGNTL